MGSLCCQKEAAESESYPLTVGVQLFSSLGITKLNNKLCSIRFISQCFLSVTTFLAKFYDSLASPKSLFKAVIKGKTIIKELSFKSQPTLACCWREERLENNFHPHCDDKKLFFTKIKILYQLIQLQEIYLQSRVR